MQNTMETEVANLDRVLTRLALTEETQLEKVPCLMRMCESFRQQFSSSPPCLVKT